MSSDIDTSLVDSKFALNDELTALREETICWLAGTAVIVAIGLLGAAVVQPGLGVPALWLIVGGLVGTAAATVYAVQRHESVAIFLLFSGLVASTLLATYVYSTGSIVFVLPLLVGIAPAVVTYRRAATVAIGMLGCVWALRLAAVAPFQGDAVVALHPLIALSLLLSWVGFRPIRKTLDWAWHSYREEQRKTDEVRQRQAELARLSKSLADTCDRLEQANVALAEARRVADDSRRLKDLFVTTISHELRTPLNLIIGFSDLLVNSSGSRSDEDAIPRDLSRDLETIYQNACHLSTLVDDVLDLGRLEAHRLAMHKKWTSLDRVVESALSTVEALYQRAGLELSADLAADLPALHLDPTRIRQVLINLLTNAVRYIETGGSRVTARRHGGDVLISVADTGLGIPPDDLAYVFEPFRQTGQLRRRGGFGLGLTVSKQFVEMHGGSMWVESAPGRGTIFQFTLPVTDNVASLVATPGLDRLQTTQMRDSDPPTILLVTADHDAAHIFERYLDGFRVVATSSKRDVERLGSAFAARRGVRAVIVSQPPTDGEELIQSILEVQPHLPVLRCSLRTINQAGQDLGAAAFLSKPISRDDLQSTIRGLKFRPRRILIVDDDPDMVRLLSTMLQTICPRCRIITAEEGMQGLSRASSGFGSRAPDLVLLDLLMPGIDGHGFMRAWKSDQARREIPVIIISAASEAGHDVVTGDAVEFCRRGGLSVGDVMQVIRGSLAAVERDE